MKEVEPKNVIAQDTWKRAGTLFIFTLATARLGGPHLGVRVIGVENPFVVQTVVSPESSLYQDRLDFAQSNLLRFKVLMWASSLLFVAIVAWTVVVALRARWPDRAVYVLLLVLFALLVAHAITLRGTPIEI